MQKHSIHSYAGNLLFFGVLVQFVKQLLQC